MIDAICWMLIGVGFALLGRTAIAALEVIKEKLKQEQQRTWVGIAPEEYPDVRYQRETYYAGIEWAEQRLKEKNA